MPFSGGVNYTILMVICMLIGIIMWYPFLKIADKKEYELELESEKMKAQETEAEMTAEEIQA